MFHLSLISASFHRGFEKFSLFDGNSQLANHRAISFETRAVRNGPIVRAAASGNSARTGPSDRWTPSTIPRNLCAPPCNYPAGSALNDFAVRIKSRRERGRRGLSYRRGVPRYRCLYLSPRFRPRNARLLISRCATPSPLASPQSNTRDRPLSLDRSLITPNVLFLDPLGFITGDEISFPRLLPSHVLCIPTYTGI